MVQPTRQRHGRRGFLRQLVSGATVAASVPPARGSAVRAQEGAITSFDHVAVPMQNTEAMIAFYRALGLQVMETDRRVSFRRSEDQLPPAVVVAKRKRHVAARARRDAAVR